MTTSSPKQISDYLRSYSLGVEYWDVDMGDSDLMLGHREVLHSSIGSMSDAEISELRRVDERVLGLALQHVRTEGWDAVMLRKTAELIAQEQRSRFVQAA